MWSVPVTGPVVVQRVGRGIALLFHERGTRRGWVVSSTPRPYLTPGKIRYPLYRRLGGPQGRSGRAENLAPSGLDPRTVQPVVSLLRRNSYGKSRCCVAYSDWKPISRMFVRRKPQSYRILGFFCVCYGRKI